MSSKDLSEAHRSFVLAVLADIERNYASISVSQYQSSDKWWSAHDHNYLFAMSKHVAIFEMRCMNDGINCRIEHALVIARV